MSEEEAVSGVIQGWQRALASQDGTTLKDLWDRDYEDLVFIAEENNETLTEWPEIERYYDALTGGSDKIAWSIGDLRAGVSGEGAWAYLTFVAEGRIEALKHDFVWNGRASFFLRKRDGGWKIIHYHESLSRDRSHDSWGWYFQG